MRNKPFRISIIVRPYQGRYIALCKETGLIREANTFEDAKDRIFSATYTLLEAYQDDPQIEPSLSMGLSFRYRVLYYWSSIAIGLMMIRDKMSTLLLVSDSSQFRSRREFAHG